MQPNNTGPQLNGLNPNPHQPGIVSDVAASAGAAGTPPLPAEVARPYQEPERVKAGPWKGMLTRRGMEQVIREGGSVLLKDSEGNARLLMRIADLPAESELPYCDSPAVREQQRAELIAQRDRLDAQIAAIKERPSTNATTPPPPPRGDAGNRK